MLTKPCSRLGISAAQMEHHHNNFQVSAFHSSTNDKHAVNGGVTTSIVVHLSILIDMQIIGNITLLLAGECAQTTA